MILHEWSFFLGLSMALCPKLCTEDHIFQFNLPIVVLALLAGAPHSPLCYSLLHPWCAGTMPLMVILSHFLLKGCAFVTERVCLQKSYLVDWVLQSLCLSSLFWFWDLCCICQQHWSTPSTASCWGFLTIIQRGLISFFFFSVRF